MLLVEAGLEVLALEPGPGILPKTRQESFDLVVIGQSLEGEAGFDLAGQLRDENETLLIVMLLPELQLPLVVRGIREGLTDVLPLHDDPKPLLRRLLGLLGETVDETPGQLELAEVEATLAALQPELRVACAARETVDLRERFQQALHALDLEREMLVAAQIGVDERARMLADERAALALQRQALANESRRVVREQEALAAEKSLWSATLGDLQTRETNLREYEEKLRWLQNNVGPGTAGGAQPVSRGTAEDLAKEWADLDKAAACLQAERAVFRDERMVLVDLDRQIRHREARLRELEQQLNEQDRMRRSLPPPPSLSTKAKLAAAEARIANLPPPNTDAFRLFTRGPFAKRTFSGG